MRIRFVAQGNWRGHNFNPGAIVEMDDASANAYIRVGQAEPAPLPPPAVASDAAAIAAKPVMDRPGAPVETAAAPARERRKKK